MRDGGKKEKRGISSAPLCDWKFNRRAEIEGKSGKEREVEGEEKERERQQRQGGWERKGERQKAQRPHCCAASSKS